MGSSDAATQNALAARLNQQCFCVTIDAEKLTLSLDQEAGEPGFFRHLAADRPHLFSNLPVFIGHAALDEMVAIVEAIEDVGRVPQYREAVLSWAPWVRRSTTVRSAHSWAMTSICRQTGPS